MTASIPPAGWVSRNCRRRRWSACAASTPASRANRRWAWARRKAKSPPASTRSPRSAPIAMPPPATRGPPRRLSTLFSSFEEPGHGDPKDQDPGRLRAVAGGGWRHLACDEPVRRAGAGHVVAAPDEPEGLRAAVIHHGGGRFGFDDLPDPGPRGGWYGGVGPNAPK